MTSGFIYFTLVQIKEWNAAIEFYKFWENRSNKVYKLSELILFILCVFYFYSVCLNSFNYFSFSNSNLVLISSEVLTKASLNESRLVYEWSPFLSLAPSSHTESGAITVCNALWAVLSCCSPAFTKQTPSCVLEMVVATAAAASCWAFSLLFLLMPVSVASCLPFSSYSRLPHGNFPLTLQNCLPAAPVQLSSACPCFPFSNLQVRPMSSSVITLFGSCPSFLSRLAPSPCLVWMSFVVPAALLLQLPALPGACPGKRQRGRSWLWEWLLLSGALFHYHRLAQNVQFGQKCCRPDPISTEVSGSFCSDFSGCWIRLWCLVTNGVFVIYFIMQISTEEHDPEKYKVLIFQCSFPTLSSEV